MKISDLPDNTYLSGITPKPGKLIHHKSQNTKTSLNLEEDTVPVKALILPQSSLRTLRKSEARGKQRFL